MNEETTDERARLIEGIASQMRRADAGKTIPWWHLTDEAERELYRAKARNHIKQVGWE